MVCSGAGGGKHEKKGKHGVGLAVRESIGAEMDKATSRLSASVLD